MSNDEIRKFCHRIDLNFIKEAESCGDDWNRLHELVKSNRDSEYLQPKVKAKTNERWTLVKAILSFAISIIPAFPTKQEADEPWD